MYRLLQISTGEPCQHVFGRSFWVKDLICIFHGSIRLPFQDIKGKIVRNASNQMHSSYSMIIIYFKLFSTLIHTSLHKLFRLPDYSSFILSSLISSFTKSKLKYLFLTSTLILFRGELTNCIEQCVERYIVPFKKRKRSSPWNLKGTFTKIRFVTLQK